MLIPHLGPTDFVLVWEESLAVLKDGTLEKDKSSHATQDSHRKWREDFLSRLQAAGIDQEMVSEAKKKISYVLLSAPWSVLCYYAEEISLRVPLQMVTTPNFNWSERMLEKIKIPNLMSQDVPSMPPDYYTCQFRTNKLERFLGSENKETFFKTTQRHQVLYEILARTPYGALKRGEVGIERLLSENAFSAAYPLHEVSAVDSQSLSMRQILHQYWARWASWKKYQPLDHIREYYGEKIALYFAWLGFYTGWLLPAAVVGTLVFLFGIWLMVTDAPAFEYFVHCPCCFTTYCMAILSSQAGLLFDNGGTVFFSIFMALWAVTFLEYWKRTSAVLAHRWDCSEFQETEERPRPEFTATAPMTLRNPVTGAEEPYFPKRRRFNRTLTGGMVIIIMVSVVLMFVVAIIVYRVILSIIIYKSHNAFLIFSAGRIASLTGSVLNLLVILMLSRVYIYLAQVLTRWEMHRTQTKYEDMFILKVFIFQFVNFYSSPVYISFFKGRFVGYPGNYYTDSQGYEKGKEGGPTQDTAPWETDYELLLCEGLFDEYLEMVLQFGFITIFVAACPLAPLFALINNWVEVRLDAQKFVSQYRRPVAERAQDIGIWLDILQVITYVAVISNAFLIAFTSDFLPRLYYRYNNDGNLQGYVNFTLGTSPSNFNTNNTQCRYRGYRDRNGHFRPEYFHLLACRLAFVIIFEHVVFFIGRLIDFMVPDIPEDVEIKIKREHYMAKEALAENEVRTPLKRRICPLSCDAEPNLKLPQRLHPGRATHHHPY
uniref:Anoctamin n=1 Tax=Oncorhynchus mykiss TaxID=8022 RepID=A0A8C7UDD5_ONCMY